MTDYSKVPVHYMLSGMQRYVEHGIEPGSFLRAVLENDLHQAVAYADSENMKALWEWCMFIYTDIPASIWGSPEKVQAHIDACAQLREYDAALKRETEAKESGHV